jgi:hypothetical protein
MEKPTLESIIMKKIILSILLFTSLSMAQTIKVFDEDYIYLKGLSLSSGGDSLMVIINDTAATRKFLREYVNQVALNPQWNNIQNKPERITNYAGSNIQIRSNVIEENATNGNGEIAINYAGYASGTTQFRDLGIYDGKNTAIAFFDGSAKVIDFFGDIDFNSYDLSSIDDLSADGITSNTIFVGDLTSNGIIYSNTGTNIDIRPASGYNTVVNYNSGNGDLINYGGTTSVKFQSYANGNVYAAGTGDFTAYKVNGSVGTAGQAIVSNGTTGGVWGTVTVANDTANMVTKATQQVITGIKRFANDIYLAGDKYIYGVSDLNLRGSGTGAVSINYGSGTDLIMYGGGTSAVFTVQETGAVYTASTVDATAYKVGGSVGTSGQILISNGSTGAVWTTGGSTVTFNGVHEASSGNDYVLVFTNGRLTSYSLYTP